MKSKVLLLALATTAFSLASKAQKVTYGVRAGINFQNINGKAPTGDDLDLDLKTGFHLGVNAEINVAPDFYVQPGLLFSTKGAKWNITNSDDRKFNLSYLELPINFLYKPALGPGKLLLGFGPYFAYAVGGKVKTGSKDKDFEFEKEITYAEYNAAVLNGYGYAKRFDVGANLLAGYELSSKISFQLNAQLGMAKINSKIKDYPSDKSKSKNTGFGISVGYRF